MYYHVAVLATELEYVSNINHQNRAHPSQSLIEPETGGIYAFKITMNNVAYVINKTNNSGFLNSKFP